VWIGLVHIKPRTGNDTFDDALGAYVNALARVADIEGFRVKVRDCFDQQGFDLVELENAEPLRLRLARADVSADLLEAAQLTRHTGEVSWGVFHTYDSEVDE
jgi:hypothetical protein